MDQHPSPIARLSRELGDSGTKEILPPTERNLTMLSEGKLEELESAALAATLGPWEARATTHGMTIISEEAGWSITSLPMDPPMVRPAQLANAAFIATFDPPTVLALISELRALRDQAAGPVEPFAWVVRTCEGNVRIWHRHREAIAERAAQMGSPLEPVYLSPPVGGEVVVARNVAHGVLLEAAWEAAAWLGAGDTVAEERLVPAILTADPDQAYARQALSELGFEVPALSPDPTEGGEDE